MLWIPVSHLTQSLRSIILITTNVLFLAQNLREELSSMMSDFEQERLQNSAQEKDEDVIKEMDNKLQEIDSLFDCIASELERIELELQTVYECHVDYETAVQDWLTWFAEAKNKLSGCQMEETNEQSIARKDQVIQVPSVSVKTRLHFQLLRQFLVRFSPC